MKKSTANIVVIFGVTGDLSNRKLFPALNDLIDSNNLPKNTIIYGCGRKNLERNVFKNLNAKISNSAKYIKIDPLESNDFRNLRVEIDTYKDKFKKINTIFYIIPTI